MGVSVINSGLANKDKILAELDRVLAELQKAKLMTTPPKSVAIRGVPPHLGADYATNVALVHAATAGLKPVQLAEEIVARWRLSSVRAEVAPPGFVNFYCDGGGEEVLREILFTGDQYGAGISRGNERRILVEYVSANPTGPLHIGHARMVAIGSALVNVMRFAGYKTDSEYYVNDSGRQMKVLAFSFCVRVAAAQSGKKIEMPTGCYRGDYLKDLAREWLGCEENHFSEETAAEIVRRAEDPAKNTGAQTDADTGAQADADTGAQADADTGAQADTDAELDAAIALVFAELGEERVGEISEYLLERMLGVIKEDLRSFGCQIDYWKRESETASGDEAEETMAELRSRKVVYEKDKALWFAGSEFGDDKDRVLRRGSGEPTYFANDIFYHRDKYRRGYGRLVNIWGADHHGYIARMRAAMQALGNDEGALEILLVQLVFLKNEGERLSMSTRAGQFVSLEDFVRHVGKDAARFLLLMRKSDRSLYFDVSLALSHSRDNPVYYVQYAHARLANILAELRRRDMDPKKETEKGLGHMSLLNEKREQDLITALTEFPELVQKIAVGCDISKLTLYLRKLAGDFHAYYNAVRVLGAGEKTPPRLCLCLAIKQVLANGLRLLEVSAPDRM